MAAPFAFLTASAFARSFLARSFVAGCFLLSGAAHADFDAAGFYQMRCSSCHGVHGEGTDQKGFALGPALKGNPLVMHGPPAALANVIRNGRSGAERVYDKGYPNMPGFGAGAVPDVEALIAYLKGALQSGSPEDSPQEQEAQPEAQQQN